MSGAVVGEGTCVLGWRAVSRVGGELSGLEEDRQLLWRCLLVQVGCLQHENRKVRGLVDVGTVGEGDRPTCSYANAGGKRKERLLRLYVQAGSMEL